MLLVPGREHICLELVLQRYELILSKIRPVPLRFASFGVAVSFGINSVETVRTQIESIMAFFAVLSSATCFWNNSKIVLGTEWLSSDGSLKLSESSRYLLTVISKPDVYYLVTDIFGQR